MARSKRIKIKDIISATLVVVILVTFVAICASFLGKETRNLSPSIFSRGSLDSSGKFIASDKQLYTEDLIECQGLSITVDFEANLQYEVFYYRQDESFIGSTGLLSEDYTKSTFDNAKYARIVITPFLEPGVEKIKFWEVRSYAKYITVAVNKKQNFVAPAEPIFSGINSFLSDVDWTTNNSISPISPVVYAGENLKAFENKMVCRIGIPITYIKYLDRDVTFTVYVLEGDGKSAFKEVAKHTLTIKANTYTNLSGSEGAYELNEVVYFDVDIKVKEGQTLGFFNKANDSITVYVCDEYLPSSYYIDVLNEPTINKFGSIYFDVWCYG